MAHQMAMAVQQELRKLPGNNKCVDCDAPYPQWATVSYGTFMCLECSGRHRGLGVHISFVRSVTMDSWTDKQIRMMQLGGNDHFRSEFNAAGVPKTLTIAQKYNTPQAEAFRARLQALVEGSSPTPLPRWDPSHNPAAASSASSSSSHGSSDTLGVEALKGESEQDYVARQMRLREEARARMAAKFGSSGMQGIGSGGSVSSSNHSSSGGYGDVTDTLGSAFSFLSTTVSSAASSAASLVKDQDLSTKVSSGWSSVQSKLADPELTTSVKSTASSGWSFLTSTTSSLLKNAQSLVDTSAQDDRDSHGGMFPRTNPTLPQTSAYEGIHGGSTSSLKSFSQSSATPLEAPEPRAATFPPATPLDATPKPEPLPKPEPKKVVKKDVDFFGEFGM
ncbi:hypothetical protein SDRG_02105 [Saprolegnia diclina VS20]|uniref:Arf-GAP domain-containing protein n=1 Tax=Saprolegnia diclina (strain VS20) TaxID=1156394 RepID=T0QSD7_SAPDV|nr:hypothetical protein SDRG_02105 [Saprolegnia diclina VS20]EQC41049.1 hypothetical protein SDRG_02105 [Saprolegnia diclina VS20]|eukprot:XP_008605893.1 hypothetical protein SDRG_02105 [Saprolegnia diclina VS20]